MSNNGLWSIRNNAALRQIYRRSKIFSHEKSANLATKNPLSLQRKKLAGRERRRKILMEIILLIGIATLVAVYLLHATNIL